MDLLLAKGDRVICKTGGPVLFVEEVYSNRRLTCSWMDEMGQRHEAPFMRDHLDKLAPFSFARASGEDGAGDADGDTLPDGDETIPAFFPAALASRGAAVTTMLSIFAALLALTRVRADATAQ